MTVLYVDIETYSSEDLKKVGVYRYTESPDFEILMAGYALDGAPVVYLEGEEAIRDALEALLQDEQVVKVAHNAAFERVCFSRLLGMPVGTYLHPRSWVDTQALAALDSRPQKLGDLALALGTEQKDTAGTRLINTFCKPGRGGKRTCPADKVDDWLAFGDYCVQDVEVLREVWRKLPRRATATERNVYIVDQLINDRGILVDAEMVSAAVANAAANLKRNRARFEELTGGVNPKSVPQVKAWLESRGHAVAKTDKEVISGLLAGDLEPDVREALELKQQLALTTSSKYTAAQVSLSRDSRLRGQFRYFGAHTGRWSGRGVQLQNLSNKGFEKDSEIESRVLDLKMGEHLSDEELKYLVRNMFLLNGTVVDYSAIEARVVAWLAGEDWVLDAFRAGRDIYVETANRMGHGMTRKEGKVAVLALGYNGGINSLKAMGGQGSDAELQKMVDLWRQTNPAIVRLWRDLGEAFGSGGSVGHLRVEKDGGDRRLRLPSGRAIVYHGVKFEDNYWDAATGKRKSGWRFQDSRFGRTGTYGGRLTENATQAVARDLLAHALVDLHRAGLPVVGHVHDEILVEGVQDVELVSRIMCDAPGWAKGLPVDGAGFTTHRYRKD